MFVLHPRWFLALALPVFATAEVYPDPPGAIAVYLGVEREASTHSMEQMKREVETLLRPAGIRVDWRGVEDGANVEVDHANLYVMRMRGTCTAERVQFLFSELGPYGEVAALGSAAMVDKRVQPFGNLECDRVRRSLSEELRGQPPLKRDALFGKVLGRIMAHELFHMVTGERKHAEHGLFRSSLQVRALATKEFVFTAGERKALRTAVRGQTSDQ